MEFCSKNDLEGFVSFQDFCFILTEKLSTEDEELLVKSTFKAFKAGRIFCNYIESKDKGYNNKEKVPLSIFYSRCNHANYGKIFSP